MAPVLRISYSVNTPVRIYGESYAHKFCALDIFLEYHTSSSNITHCQVPSSVRAWFHDSTGDIDFYQMSPSPSESTILHESIILIKVLLRLAYLTMYVCSAMGPAAMFGTSVPKSLFLCRFFGFASKFLKVNSFTVIMFRSCRMACSGNGIHLNIFKYIYLCERFQNVQILVCTENFRRF